MKLLNATNKKTDKLAQYGLVDQGIAVEGDLLMPGKTVDVPDEQQTRIETEHAHLFEVGALVWDVKESLPNALVELKSDAPVEGSAEVSLKEAPKKRS